jgi:ATP-dependent RNA helicase RhlE
METVSGYEPSRPVRLDAPMPAQGRAQRNGGQRNGGDRNGGQQRPTGGKPAHRAHGKPASRGAHPHAGPKQHRGSGKPGVRRDTRA